MQRMVVKALKVVFTTSLVLDPHNPNFDSLYTHMAILRALPSSEIVSGFKGKVDFYLWHTIKCARRWPKSPGKHRSPAVEAQWPAFTTASRLWNELSPEIRQAYDSMAQGGALNGRDLAARAYLKGLYTYPH